MRWNWLLALSFFLVAFAAALVLQAPAGLVRRVLGSAAPAALELVAPHSTVLAGEIPALRIGTHGMRIAWRCRSLSLSPLGPVYHVDVIGVGFTGEGRLALAPHHRRVLLTDAGLTFRSPNIGKAVFQPLGRMFVAKSISVTIDRFDVDLRLRHVHKLTGLVRWDDARLDLVPGINLGAVEARLSAPGYDQVRLDVANSGGTVALSGTVAVSVNGDVKLDLLLESRPGSRNLPADVLALVATPEGRGWRFRQTMSLRGRL